MGRIPIIKELENSKLASTYGGWLYCDCCGENMGYLCYVTYDNFRFKYECNCGEKGSIHIAFGDVEDAICTTEKMLEIKNRLCCTKDDSPLLTILEKKLAAYTLEIDCCCCKTRYSKKKTK